MKNKEIEKLLEYLKDENWNYYPSDLIPYKVLLMEEIDLLLSYIEQLEKEYNRSLDKLRNLRVENEQLENNRDKAIEYIEIELSQGGERELRDLVDGYEVLKLLKGDSDEQE